MSMRRRFAAFAVLAAVSLLADSPNAMAAVTSTPVFLQAAKLGVVQFLQGTDVAGTYKTLYTAGSNGSRCSAIVATSSDGSAAHLLTLQIVRSTIKYGGTAVNVAVSSGFAAGSPPVNLMSSTNWAGLPVDSNGNPFLHLQSGDTLQATFATALTSSTVINVIAVCGDY